MLFNLNQFLKFRAMPVFLTWEQQQIGQLSQITWICHLQLAVF